MENTYKIVCNTDPYHASRDSRFPKFCTSFTLQSSLTLKQAQKQLLNDFCEDAEIWCPNWGVAVNTKNIPSLIAHRTAKDGTRSYSYDIYTYSIEEETPQDIFRQIGGDEFADLFIFSFCEASFHQGMEEEVGFLTDEILDLVTMEIRCDGNTRKFDDIHDAVEALYDSYCSICSVF